MKLVHKDTDKPVEIGETVTDFRGKDYVVANWKEPKEDGKTGYVYVKESRDSDHTMSYYPGVFGLIFERESK